MSQDTLTFTNGSIQDIRGFATSAIIENSWEEEDPPVCIHVSDAIRAQGIDDVTSWAIVQVLFGLVYSGLFLLGLAGNGGVLWAVCRNKRLRSARNIFLLNLILTDLLLCSTAVPVTPWYALTKEWRFGSLMCRLMPLSNSCAVFVTSWSLTAIALDKFLHIIDPTREPFSVRVASFITILIWLICSLVNIPYLLSYELVDGAYYVPKNATPFCGMFCDEINWQGETQRRLYGSTVMLFQFVVPMAIITYCYWRILDKVHKDMIIQNAQFSQSLTNSQRVDAINRKKRVNYILIAMVLAFIGCWLPMTAINLAKDFKTEPTFVRLQPYLWPLIAHVIAMSTVIWNPLLFFWLTRKQKRSNLGGMLHTSDIMTSLASRVHSLRSTSGESTNEARFKRRHQQSLMSNRETALATKCNNNNYTLLNNNSNNTNRSVSTTNRPLVVKNGVAAVSRNGSHASSDSRQHALVQKAVSLSSHQML
ncbi:7 transmembrane receptor (rhodopsin family) domain-containing protein [Ditylenchus destructor]|uniref:7 transmembrane receptor (Rhodopsin family) domain-containing protein n=1 Tax=Ditylenchus destructor TaxID=166010 RepID=A0AAD4N9U9_9BILA|nr:7 transmembrane receptor (rhodopsin family) domain-containing protein [Ditylenchus destructor]